MAFDTVALLIANEHLRAEVARLEKDSQALADIRTYGEGRVEVVKPLRERIVELEAEVERLKATIHGYDDQFVAISATVGGDASGLPDGYEWTIAGRVQYEFEQLRTDAAAGRRLLGDDDHPEHSCDLCGGKNITWFAESDLWNKYAGDHQILCPICFVKMAIAGGEDPTAWRVAPTDDSDECDGLRVRFHEAMDIIHRLPVTKDGVWVVPGMFLWTNRCANPKGFGFRVMSINERGFDNDFDLSECYSTLEAMQAGREGESEAEDE